MINDTHFVVDLETFGKGSRAAIASIGITCLKAGIIDAQLYLRVAPQTHVALGAEMDADTVRWWLRQDDLARAEVDGSQPCVDIMVALASVTLFLEEHAPERDDRIVWGNGASFDNVILRNAYKAALLPPPWDFWNDADLRTITRAYPDAKKSVPFTGTKHHAGHDAAHEAMVLGQALRLHAGLPLIEME